LFHVFDPQMRLSGEVGCGSFWYRWKAHTRFRNACSSQAARQGLAVLMASAIVVLKHETSTTYQSHIYKSIDLKLGYSDYVTSFSNPAKFSEDRCSGGAPTRW